MTQEAAAPAARPPYDSSTDTDEGAVRIRAEAGGGQVTLQLSRLPFAALKISADQADVVALHLFSASKRARAA